MAGEHSRNVFIFVMYLCCEMVLKLGLQYPSSGQSRSKMSSPNASPPFSRSILASLTSPGNRQPVAYPGPLFVPGDVQVT